MNDARSWLRARGAAVMKKWSVLPDEGKRHALALLLWAAIVGVILLPALSQIGYMVYSLEYLLVVAASILAGFVCLAASKIRFVGPILLVVLTSFSVIIYFGAIILSSVILKYMFIPLLSAFVVFSFDKPRIALRFSGLVAIAQIVATAIVPPATTVMLTERDVPKKDFPSVVHILLDGHAGIATIPERAVDSDDVKRLVDTYVSRGFTVFRRAYSADKYTQLSIARLFNPPRESLPLEQNPKTRTFSLQSAKILEEISRKRSPDLTYSTYMQLTPAIRNLPNVSRLHMTRAFGGVTTPEFSNMPLADRLWSAAAMVRAWFIKKAESPLVAVFFKFTDFGQYWNAEFKPASWSNPLLARALFQKLIQRLECCGERGSYIFAHLIYPHHPFIFDEACQVRPSRQWVDALNHHAWQPDTIETWKVRWKRHFEQAYCAATDVAHLVDTTSQRDELADATIIVHSDHGARVRIRDYEEQNVEGYDAEDDERALRGAFLAVRIPGVLQGAVIETPVRVDEVYRQLAKQDFRNLDLTAFMPGPDSPYTDWEPSSSIALEGH